MWFNSCLTICEWLFLSGLVYQVDEHYSQQRGHSYICDNGGNSFIHFYFKSVKKALTIPPSAAWDSWKQSKLSAIRVYSFLPSCFYDFTSPFSVFKKKKKKLKLIMFLSCPLSNQSTFARSWYCKCPMLLYCYISVQMLMYSTLEGKRLFCLKVVTFNRSHWACLYTNTHPTHQVFI